MPDILEEIKNISKQRDSLKTDVERLKLTVDSLSNEKIQSLNDIKKYNETIKILSVQTQQAQKKLSEVKSESVETDKKRKEYLIEVDRNNELIKKLSDKNESDKIINQKEKERLESLSVELKKRGLLISSSLEGIERNKGIISNKISELESTKRKLDSEILGWKDKSAFLDRQLNESRKAVESANAKEKNFDILNSNVRIENESLNSAIQNANQIKANLLKEIETTKLKQGELDDLKKKADEQIQYYKRHDEALVTREKLVELRELRVQKLIKDNEISKEIEALQNQVK